MTEPDLRGPSARPARADLRGSARDRVLDHRDGDAPGGAVCGTCVARNRRRRLSRRAPSEHAGIFEGVGPRQELPAGADFRRILVPMKLGPIGEEMIATAVALAKEREASVYALFVILVPLEHPLDAPLHDREEQAAASIAEALLLGEEHEVARRAADGPGSLDRQGDRRAGRRARSRSDRARLVASLAPTVCVLLADSRLRAAHGALRGARGRLSAGGPGGRRLRVVKAGRDRLRPSRVGRRAGAAPRTAGR